MSNHRAGLLQLHTAVLLFGVAGLFGKWLTVSPMMIVLGRTIIATLALGGLLALKPALRSPVTRQLAGRLAVSGIVLAFHWVSFFQSIRVSSVAVGLLTVSSFPLFVTLLEPILFSERFRRIDLLTAMLVLAGLILIVPKFDFSNGVTQGACWGVLAGLSFALLSLLNRRLVEQHSSIVVAVGQNLFAAIAIAVFLPLYAETVSARDFGLLALLGVFCTAVSHSLFIQSLNTVRTQLASVVSGLESVYGIFFARVLLHEIPSARTLAGGILILLAIVVGTFHAPRPRSIEGSNELIT